MEIKKLEKYKEYKTQLQWEKAGFKIKRNQTPLRLWSNGFRNEVYSYYSPRQVKPMTEKEIAAFKEKEAAKRKQSRIKRMEIIKREKELRMEIEKREKELRKKYERLIALRNQVKQGLQNLKYDKPYRELIVIDTETTGLTDDDELLQVSIIDENGEELYNSYLKPLVKEGWSSAQLINGISPQMVEDAPSICTEAPKIAEILKSAKKIVGYNVYFDLGFLRDYGIEPDPEAGIIDVMKIFAEIYGEWNDYYENYKWQKLVTCAAYYRFDWTGLKAHDSLADCQATLFCYKKILEKQKEENKDGTIV